MINETILHYRILEKLGGGGSDGLTESLNDVTVAEFEGDGAQHGVSFRRHTGSILAQNCDGPPLTRLVRKFAAQTALHNP